MARAREERDAFFREGWSKRVFFFDVPVDCGADADEDLEAEKNRPTLDERNQSELLLLLLLLFLVTQRV